MKQIQVQIVVDEDARQLPEQSMPLDYVMQAQVTITYLHW